jgi:gamma-glutamylcyclotransferase (GGCT)/AIG2-like uncharacterized protein YtfP
MHLMSDLLFVYGTLRKGNANEMAEYLHKHAEFLSDGWFRGRMYMISYYPGVVASDEKNDRVYGEIYRLHDAQTALTILDAYEECIAQHAQPAEYKRVTANIDSVDGHVPKSVWIYLYQWPTVDKVMIQEGDFMKALRTA